LENSHPRGKTCSARLLWRQDFIVSGKCKLETRTHMGKLAATIQMASPHLSLWRQDFILSLCGDKISSCRSCKLKTCSHMGKLAATWENLHPHGKTCSHGLKTCAHESLGTQLFSDSFMPGNGAFSEAAQAQPKGSINMPVPCLPKPRGPKGRGPSAQALLPTDSAEEPETVADLALVPPTVNTAALPGSLVARRPRSRRAAGHLLSRWVPVSRWNGRHLL